MMASHQTGCQSLRRLDGAPTGGFVSPRRRAIGAGILATLVALFLIAGWLDHQAGSRMREAEQARQIEKRAR